MRENVGDKLIELTLSLMAAPMVLAQGQRFIWRLLAMLVYIPWFVVTLPLFGPFFFISFIIWCICIMWEGMKEGE